MPSRVHEGEFFALIGQNGCGKSSLLGILDWRGFRRFVKTAERSDEPPQRPGAVIAWEAHTVNFAARIGSFVRATMTSTPARTNSVASPRRSAVLPSAQRQSIARFLPSP